MSERVQHAHELVDLSRDAMFTRDFDSRVITFWNEGAERLYGFTRQEAMGKRPQDLLETQYPIPLEEIEDVLREKSRWEGELVQRRKDGSKVAVWSRWGLQLDIDGRPNAILEINSDLTQQRADAIRLLQSEERLSLLVAAVKDYAIFMLDPNGIVMTWNEGAQRAKGYTADEIIGRHFSAFYTPEDTKDNKPARLLAKAERDGSTSDEGWRVRKDGTRFWASVVITALRDDSGRLRGFGKVTRDMTDRHRDEEALRAHAERMAALEQAKTQFLDLAAHELRGPLTLIRGYNSMLGEGGLSAERITQIAHVLEGKLAQVDLLVEQMLEMARLENENLELTLEPFDLRKLTQDQIIRFQPVAIRHSLTLSDDSDTAIVVADRSRVLTIVGNLIDNAIKYSPAGGAITCSVGSTDGQRYVTVLDHGIGIAPEHMPLLFKRFSRLPTEQNKSIAGTGLALFLCQEIAHRLDGEITVKSKVGRGSEFTLLLPGGTAAA